MSDYKYTVPFIIYVANWIITEMSMEAKAFKEPDMSMAKAAKEPEMSMAKTAKVMSTPVEWVQSSLSSYTAHYSCSHLFPIQSSMYSAKAEKVMSVAKSDKEPAMRLVSHQLLHLSFITAWVAF